jgi:hypothetical protein
MSLSSVQRAAADPELIARVEACANQEALNNPELSETLYARQLKAGLQNVKPLMWPVAVATEVAYETALQSGRGAPGHDVDIITDGDITAAVQANWPPDPNEPPPV